MNENTTPLTTTSVPQTAIAARHISTSENGHRAEFAIILEKESGGCHMKKLRNGMYITQISPIGATIVEPTSPADYTTEKKTVRVKGYNGFEEKEIEVTVPPTYKVMVTEIMDGSKLVLMTHTQIGQKNAVEMAQNAKTAVDNAGKKRVEEELAKGDLVDIDLKVKVAKKLAFTAFLRNNMAPKPYTQRKQKVTKAPRVKRIRTEDDDDTGGKKGRGKGDKNKPRKGGKGKNDGGGKKRK